MSFEVDGYALEREGGEHYWAFNSVMSIKTGGDQTHDTFTVVEVTCPPGFGPPPHVHSDEDEAWYILEGQVSFTCGEKTWTATQGSFVLAPRAIEHTFRTWDEGPVKMLQITAPAGFEGFAADMGEPADEPAPRPRPVRSTLRRETDRGGAPIRFGVSPRASSGVALRPSVSAGVPERPAWEAATDLPLSSQCPPTVLPLLTACRAKHCRTSTHLDRTRSLAASELHIP